MNIPEAHPSPPCPFCTSLKDRESASQKYGWEENDTHLPPAASQLIVVRYLRLGESRAFQLWQCPVCRTYYLYETYYEYLVNGSEDTQTLTRLTEEQALEYLHHRLE